MKTPPGYVPTHHWPEFPDKSLDFWGAPKYGECVEDLVAWCLRRRDTLTKGQHAWLVKAELLGIKTRRDAEKIAVIVNILRHAGHRMCWCAVDSEPFWFADKHTSWRIQESRKVAIERFPPWPGAPATHAAPKREQ